MSVADLRERIDPNIRYDGANAELRDIAEQVRRLSQRLADMTEDTLVPLGRFTDVNIGQEAGLVRMWAAWMDVTQLGADRIVSSDDWRGRRFYWRCDVCPGTPAAAATAQWKDTANTLGFQSSNLLFGPSYAADYTLMSVAAAGCGSFDMVMLGASGRIQFHPTAFTARYQIRFTPYLGTDHLLSAPTIVH